MFLFSLMSPITEKKIFMISYFIQAGFLIKIQPTISEQERIDKESMICLTPKPSWSFIVYHIQSKEKNYA